ncbi:hypothetical protein G9A89_017628 [Geosiphon pyriformis]|nr:hypothetical protein G9A89_017628 [Geosiphon pyriformis]
MALAKIKEATPKEIKTIKNNSSEPIKLDWNPEPCNLIYNPLLCMIYTISEEEPISSCTSESESVFNPNSNSDNDDNENTGSSSMQYGNKNINGLDSNSNPKIYIAFLDLSKKQELK